MGNRSDHIYRFIGTVWDYLPVKDRERFSELWRGYEQTLSDVFNRYIELDQALNIETIPPYSVLRWQKLDLSSDTTIEDPATLLGTVDISQPVDLSERYLLKLQVNEREPLEIDVRGEIAEETSIQEIAEIINNAFFEHYELPPVAFPVVQDALLEIRTPDKGPNKKVVLHNTEDPDLNASFPVFGRSVEELPYQANIFRYRYKLEDSRTRKIPNLRDAIRMDSLGHVYIEGSDYQIDIQRSAIYFVEEPPPVLWGKVVYIDEELPFFNFGYYLNYRDTTVPPPDYLLTLQSFWFSFWMGPRPEFIRRSICLLLGLPVAVSAGIVNKRSPVAMEIIHQDGTVKSYLLPSGLEWTVQVGDIVEQFEPLSTGVELLDKVNYPGFVTTHLDSESLKVFSTEDATQSDHDRAVDLLEEHTFLPQIQVEAFERTSLDVNQILFFLREIRPLHKIFHLQIFVASFEDIIEFLESTAFSMYFEVTPNLELNPPNTSEDTTRQDYEVFPDEDLDLDSEVLYMMERGTLEFRDRSGPLPQYNSYFF